MVWKVCITSGRLTKGSEWNHLERKEGGLLKSNHLYARNKVSGQTNGEKLRAERVFGEVEKPAKGENFKPPQQGWRTIEETLE